MYLQAESPGRSLRAHRGRAGEMIVGGESHERGQRRRRERFAALEALRLPEIRRRHSSTAGRLTTFPDDGAYIGRSATADGPESERRRSGWRWRRGGRDLADEVAGASTVGGRLRPRPDDVALGAPKLLKHTTRAGCNSSETAPPRRSAPTSPPGTTGDRRRPRRGGQPRNDGVLQAVSARCTHLADGLEPRRRTWDGPARISIRAGGAVANARRRSNRTAKRPPTAHRLGRRAASDRLLERPPRADARAALHRGAKLNIRGARR